MPNVWKWWEAALHDDPVIGHIVRMVTRCCDRMDYDLAQTCDIHTNRADCPDALIAEVRGGYGLFVHDGGGSVIGIGFCPWCGAALPPIGDLDLSAMERDGK